MSEPPSDIEPSGPGSLSPGAARRRLGNDLRTLREGVGLKLDAAGRRIQRSPATMSRLEKGKSTARLIEVAALLDFYAETNPRAVPPDVRERVLRLAADSRRSQWFEPFRDVLTGSMTSDHNQRYVEYETDASEIRTFEPELVPGLLQTGAYALAVAEAFFPGHTGEQRRRFADFRTARQQVLNSRPEPVRLSVAIGESVLRRSLGNSIVHREQLEALRADLTGSRPNVSIHVVPMTANVPAAFGGPFVIMSFDNDDDQDIVYLETRSGADYLQDNHALERFQLYFDSLLEVAVTNESAVSIVDAILGELA